MYRAIARKQDSPKASIARWAIGFAYNEVLSRRRRKARDRLVFSVETLAHLLATIGEESSLLKLRRRALGVCLQKLTESERELVVAFVESWHCTQRPG